MPTFKIYTLGCKVNQYDSGSLKYKLIKNGLKPAEKNQQADLVIVNTCSVTKNAHRKDRRMIDKAKKDNPQAKIVVMGCWFKVYPEIEKKLQADLFWPVGKLDKLIGEITKKFNKELFSNKRNDNDGVKKINNNKKTNRRKSGDGRDIIKSPGQGERSRYFMKVQDGCNQFCSYCVIPYSRGRLQSRAWEDIIREAQEVEEAGYREIILCGIHLGLYNQEENSQQKDQNLTWLIKKILTRTKKLRVRISSIEVNDISDDLINLLKIEKRFCNHLHIPLQGGEDKLLKLMNRPYDVKYFKNKILQIRKTVPTVAITADVIVGFPTESKQQFQQTCDLVQDLQLSKLHVFPYSGHEKTVAFKMSGQVDGKIKKERSKILREISDNLWNEYQKKIKKEISQFEIVIEDITGDTILGKTEYYFDIKVPKIKIEERKLKIGELIKVDVSI